MLESHANHPAAGSTSQTLTWSLDDQGYGSGWLTLFFLDGVDVDDIINATTDSDYTQGATTSWAPTLANVTTDEDMAIIAASCYYNITMSLLLLLLME